MTRLVAVADLHGNLPTDLPGGDVLVIAGDVCPLSDHAVAFQRSWLVEELYPWMDALPHPEIVWIAGNHDFACQSPGWEPGGRGTYLLDEGTTAAGLSFHGTPWVPNLRRWAFYGDDDLRSAKTALIPPVDVLVSHGPPRGTGDRLVRGSEVGCRFLAAASRRCRRDSASSATSTRHTASGNAPGRRLRTSPTSTRTTTSAPVPPASSISPEPPRQPRSGAAGSRTQEA